MLSLEKQILYMIRHRREMTTSEMIHIYKERGKSEQIIRNTLSSLKQKGYITAEDRTYTITDAGLHVILSLQIKMNGGEQPWDGRWHLVMFSFPEQQRSLRNAFRRELVGIGYGLLYDGVFICPFNRQEAVLAFAERHELESMIRMVHGDMDFGGVTPSQALHIWPILAIQEKYEKFIAWAATKQNQLSLTLEHESSSSAWKILLEILELGEAFGEILLEDPFLPQDLLPGDWAMKLAWDAYNQYLQQLIPHLQEDTELLSLILPTS
ncbi:PaaX family transcriptional regulator C-terminal domain-containing protein [Paenibacillus sp. SI8]|uniref:PaaX family transcriptional regulator C-terminal domain-containing protein n=1 Tax=unclassified Paenibacillus TaxID=185978 RepID=UPI003466C346